jgi:hypothetical protein
MARIAAVRRGTERIKARAIGLVKGIGNWGPRYLIAQEARADRPKTLRRSWRLGFMGFKGPEED